MHALIIYPGDDRLFHATIISFVNLSLCRIVKKAKVTNLEAVINCVFIDKSFDNSDIHFQYLGVPQRWDKLWNTCYDALASDMFIYLYWNTSGGMLVPVRQMNLSLQCSSLERTSSFQLHHLCCKTYRTDPCRRTSMAGWQALQIDALMPWFDWIFS